MRKFLLAAAVAMLAGCGPSSTPFTRALSALKAGDYAAFVTAKAEVDGETKTAIQPDGDLCLMTMADVDKYGAARAVERLDHADIFKLSEEARYLLAFRWAGKGMQIDPSHFLSRAPIYESARTGTTNERCVGDRNPLAAMQAGMPIHTAFDEPRMQMMREWMYEMKQKLGSQYEDKMRTARNELSMAGYNAPFPVEFDFMERQ
jgi:hypothetical protein